MGTRHQKSGLKMTAGLVLFLLLFGGGYLLGYQWFLGHFEKKTFDRRVGFSQAAQSNPLLAAERLLTLSGREVSSHKGRDLLVQPPAATDTIVLRSVPGGIKGSVADRLYHWIEAGGHLIMIPEFSAPKGAGTNALLDRVGAGIAEHKDCGCDDETPASQPAGKTQKEQSGPEGKPDQKPQHNQEEEESFFVDAYALQKVLPVDCGGQRVEVAISSQGALVDTGQQAVWSVPGAYFWRKSDPNDPKKQKEQPAGAAQADWLLQYAVGTGRLTVLSEIRLFENNNLQELDNGFFLRFLTQGRGRVWLLYANDIDSLPQQIWQRFPFLVLTALFFVLCWVWRIQERLAPPQRSIDYEQRSVIGHIDAMGRFLWRADRGAKLVGENRTDLFRLLRRFFSADSALDSTLFRRQVAEKTGMAEDEIDLALFRPVQQEQDLILISRAQQHLLFLLKGERQKNI